MNWKLPPQPTEESPEVPNWDHMAEASANTLYFLHDQGDRTFRAVVVERKGRGTLNTGIGLEHPSLDEAKKACEADWASGKRK
jgi:hypothetical protein